MSKDKFDASYFFQGEIVYLGEFVNNINGFKKLRTTILEATKIKTDYWFACFENTGVYSTEFLLWLIGEEIACKEENAIQISKSLGLKRGKDDKSDSKAICRYAYEKRDLLKASKAPKESLTKLKSIVTRRKLLDKQKTALSVSVSEQKKTMNETLFKVISKSNKAILKLITQEIKSLDKLINQILKKDEDLKKNAKLCLSICGIGPLTTAVILIRTNNFEDIIDPRKLACYCGIAPFPNSSGKRKGKSTTSSFGDRYLKAILSNCAQNAVRYDNEIKIYFERKIDQGKLYGVVMNAVKNKLIHRIYAVVKRGTPYVKINTYA